MSQNIVLLLSTWGVLAVIVLILAAYRSQLGRREDDTIHMADFESGTVAQQTQIAHKIDNIERWGKTLTVLLVLYGLALGAYYMYSVWQAQNSTVIMQ